MAINLKLSSSANGTRNVSFNPVIVSTETNIFGMDRSTPTNYLVPGNGNPAVSTSAYYQTFGLYNFRPYDLLQWGSTGTAAMAANGGKRYVWCCSGDHPSDGAYGFIGGEGFYVGFSDQPGVFPKTFEPILSLQKYGTYNTPQHTISGGFITYEFPRLVYNPDDVDGLPIYLFAEAGGDHWTSLHRSSDFITFVRTEISHWHTQGVGQWSSFMRYNERTATNQFTSICLSNTAPNCSIWTTTNGIDYTTAGAAIVGMENSPDPSGSTYVLGGTFTVGGQLYAVARESATGGGNNMHVTIYPMNGTTFDKIESPVKVRLQSNAGANTGFPGPTFLQETPAFEEDGILYVTPTYGFCSDINTTANGSGRGGAPYSGGGGLDHQFIDRIIVRVNDTAARLAAPVQVTASCVAGTVTLSWKDALPQNTYRVYRGTTSATQATLVGDVTGTSTTDSPATGRYWYKVVTMDGGTERQSRVVSVYVSSSTAFVNEHIDRVLEDGGDSSTINRAFLDRADAMLDSVGVRDVLELMTHPACGVNTAASPIKIYDLGTTRLPRSQDFKATTTDTTYSATSVNTGPGWTNSTTSAYGYWGHIKRGNTIQQKRQITIIAAYERSQTGSDLTFVGTGPIWGTTTDGTKILSLKHTAGSPGSIEFALSDETSTKTASVTASGSGMQIAVGTYDGTDMLAYTGSTAGSAVSTLDPNPDFGRTSGTPGYILGSLAGARQYRNNGTANDSINGPFSFRMVVPFLGSGSVHCHTLRTPLGDNDATIFNEANAQGKIQCIMVFERALTPTEIGNIISFLQSTADW